MEPDRVETGSVHIAERTALEKEPPVLFASRMALREGNGKKPIYEVHKWWARRLGSVFRSILIGAITPEAKAATLRNGAFYHRHDLTGLVVLDPFVGGGTSVVEAAKCGASVIGVDIDPVACFVTSKELEPVTEVSLCKAYRAVEKAAKGAITKWYRTRLPDGRAGSIVYAFWVDVVRCSSCKSEALAHPHFQLSRYASTRRQTVFCSGCGQVRSVPLSWKTFTCRGCDRKTTIGEGTVKGGVFKCPSCSASGRLSRLASRRQPPRHELFALQVLIDGSNERVFKKADAADRALYRRAQRALYRLDERQSRFLPSERIPTHGRHDSRPVSYGYKRYRDLFNARQKLCLAILASAIDGVEDKTSREFLALAFSDALAANNMLCFYAFDYQKLTPLFGLHAFYKPTRPVENNVWGIDVGRGSFVKCFQKVLRGKRYGRFPFEYRYSSTSDRPEQVFTGDWIRPTMRRTVPAEGHKIPRYAVVLNQSAERLDGIGSASVDLILTDPPYYDNLAYSELSDFYHVWLRRLRLPGYQAKERMTTPLSRSLYVRRDRRHLSPDHERFSAGLRSVFAQCHRVLKDSGLFLFTFHHHDPAAWASLGGALSKAPFKITSIFPVRSEGRSQFHSDDGNLKWDAVFCCRKLGSRDVRSIRDSELPVVLSSARAQAQRWKVKLTKAGLEFGSADRDSLTYALAVAHFCNEGIEPSGLQRLSNRRGRPELAGYSKSSAQAQRE